MAYTSGTLNPFAYFADQVPNHAVAVTDFTPQAVSVTLQIVNVMALLAAVGVACSFTSDAFTARVYLLFISLADYGHIYAVYRTVGEEYFWDYKGWNSMVGGNVGASAALNVFRLLTLAGAFGPIRSTVAGAAGEKKRV